MQVLQSKACGFSFQVNTKRSMDTYNSLNLHHSCQRPPCRTPHLCTPHSVPKQGTTLTICTQQKVNFHNYTGYLFSQGRGEGEIITIGLQPRNSMWHSQLHVYCQELISGEAAKERVTVVPSKSRLPTYFRFCAASAYVLRIVTYLAPGNEASARVRTCTYVHTVQLAS